MPRKKNFDRDEVLQKAMELFWQKGFHATSMQDLVDHLGIKRSSIYATFDDKQSLFQAAFDLYRHKTRAETAAFLAAHSSVKEGFRALFQQAICQTIDDPNRKGCFVVNAATELASGPDPIIPAVKEAQAQSEALFHSYLLQGEATGEIPAGKDLKTIATMIFIYHNGVKVLAKTQDRAEKLTNTIELVMSLLE